MRSSHVAKSKRFRGKGASCVRGTLGGVAFPSFIINGSCFFFILSYSPLFLPASIVTKCSITTSLFSSFSLFFSFLLFFRSLLFPIFHESRWKKVSFIVCNFFKVATEMKGRGVLTFSYLLDETTRDFFQSLFLFYFSVLTNRFVHAALLELKAEN